MNYLCPVCGTEVVVTHQSTLDEATLAEQDEECPNGCWSAEYLYGSHSERIGEQVWSWHYTESKEDYNKRRQEMKTATQRMKQCL